MHSQVAVRPTLRALFKVGSACGKKPPANAHVAILYKGYWFYIDERDRDTKATFSDRKSVV